MKKREGDAWMPADEYGRSLSGLMLNLLVADIERSVNFQTKVMQAQCTYADVDFAVLSALDHSWMLHADHTYLDHPMHGIATQAEGRGAGAEIRLIGCDPDEATRVARQLQYTVLEAPTDKPHGLREAFIVDDDGYIWVPSVATPG